MDFLVIFVALVAGFFGGFVGGFVMKAVRATYAETEIESLKRQVRNSRLAEQSAFGNEAKQEQAERLQMAMAEVSAIMQEGLEPAERNKRLLALIPKYPDIAAKYGKKFMAQLKDNG